MSSCLFRRRSGLCIAQAPDRAHTDAHPAVVDGLGR